jgi:hypothetical protein
LSRACGESHFSLNIYLLIGQGGGTPLLVFVPLCLLAWARLKKKGENPRGGHSSEKRVIPKSEIFYMPDVKNLCSM